jgi:hypothetical protein
VRLTINRVSAGLKAGNSESDGELLQAGSHEQRK